jgi:hypothetical protein
MILASHGAGAEMRYAMGTAVFSGKKSCVPGLSG